jgi:predicted membrane channel-forming protein YqfA (hemolysin III family)
MKTVAYIGAGILILFGALMVIGATDPTGNSSWLFIGILLIAVGLVIIYFAARKKPEAPTTNVTLKVDLPGDVNMDSLKCKSCGGVLSAENIAMVQGAPMVTCPFCHTVYQLTEDPKW